MTASSTAVAAATASPMRAARRHQAHQGPAAGEGAVVTDHEKAAQDAGELAYAELEEQAYGGEDGEGGGGCICVTCIVRLNPAP